jgi:hypothetical protein
VVVLCGAAALLSSHEYWNFSLRAPFSPLKQLKIPVGEDTETRVTEESGLGTDRVERRIRDSCPGARWYLLTHTCAGLNNNRWSMAAAAMIAHLTGATLVLPRVPLRGDMCLPGMPCCQHGITCSGNASWTYKTFDWLYDRSHFEKSLAQLNISVEAELPDCLRSVYESKRLPVLSTASFGEHREFPSQENSNHVDTDWSMREGKYYATHPSLTAPKLCSAGTSPNYLPGWEGNCGSGLLTLDCALFSFKPTSPEESHLWKQLFDAQRFAAPVKQLQRSISDLMGGRYWSIHLRIEADMIHFWSDGLDGMNMMFSQVAGMLRKLDLQAGSPVFVAVGAARSTPEVKAFLNNADVLVLGLRFFFIEDIPKELSHVLTEDDRELEFAGAVAYEICLNSEIHIGPYISSFDFMLHVERGVQTGGSRTFPITGFRGGPHGIFFELFPIDLYPLESLDL